MLRIRVLGELLVEVSGRPVELTGSWRGRSLLAWLALHPGSHPRSDLAPRFWPDVLDSSARASLRNALWAIRRSLGDQAGEAVAATRERVGLAGPPKVWVDAAAFEEHLAAGRLDEALALCRGELLAGLDEEWIYEHRDAHRRRVSELLERMATRAESGGDRAGAIAWTRRRVSLDPLDEEAQRGLIARLTASGDRAGALAAYGRLRQRLRSDLGISPSEETHALVREMREGAAPARAEPRRVEPRSLTPPAPATGLPDRLAQAAASPWVGRGEQLRRLRAELDRTLQGETRLLLLTGEGGIGKTRLLAELAGSAGGCAVLYGRCDEDELFPFGPWIGMLGGHLDRVSDAELEALLGDAGPDLARLLPELRSRLPGLHERPPSDPETERGRLFSAVVAVIARLAERCPLLVIIDDLHWADRSSLLLGRHLARAAGLGRVFMLGTYRDTELSEHHPLLEVLADLERDQPIERIRLGGLGEDEVAELAEALGRELEPGTLRAIREETQGNPFFVKQLLRHLEEEGEGPSGGEFGLPAGLRDVIARRVARLPDAAGKVLRVAAIAGRDFEWDVLERVVDLPEDELLDSLDAAVRGGILTEVEAAPGCYSFVHALLRTTLERELTSTRRALLHRRVGEAIESRYREHLDRHLADLARHFAAAGPAEVGRAVAYAERAAEQATERLAYEEAVRLLAGALAALERVNPVDDRERSRLLLSLAAARLRAGRWDEARETYARAAEYASAAREATLFARATLGHSGGAWERYGTEDPASVALLRQALRWLPDEDSSLRAQVLARLSGVLYYSAEDEESAAALAHEAIAMARRLDHDAALATALLAAQFALWRPGQAEARWELAEELLEVTERLGDLEAVAGAHAWRVTVLLELCRLKDADAGIARHAELAERLKQPEVLMHAAAFRSMRALLEGDWAEGESAAHEVLSVGARSTAVDALQYYGVEMMALLHEQLRMDELTEQTERLAREIAALPGWRTPVAWAHVQAGRPELAYAELDELRRDNFAILPRDANYDAALAIVSHVAGELGDAVLAAEVEPLLRPLAEYWVVMGPGVSTLGPVAYCLGLLDLLQGKLDAARRDFELALAKSRSMRARPYEAHSLLGLSQVLRRSSSQADKRSADELRGQALAIAEKLGMKRLLRDANAILSASR
jgi:DNA-binding SARP family transcriptional activator/tetratricopeptide (TPR) repeat protein